MLHTVLDVVGVALFFACYTYALGSLAAEPGNGDDPSGPMRPVAHDLALHRLVSREG